VKPIIPFPGIIFKNNNPMPFEDLVGFESSDCLESKVWEKLIMNKVLSSDDVVFQDAFEILEDGESKEKDPFLNRRNRYSCDLDVEIGHDLAAVGIFGKRFSECEEKLKAQELSKLAYDPDVSVSDIEEFIQCSGAFSDLLSCTDSMKPTEGKILECLSEYTRKVNPRGVPLLKEVCETNLGKIRTLIACISSELNLCLRKPTHSDSFYVYSSQTLPFYYC